MVEDDQAVNSFPLPLDLPHTAQAELFSPARMSFGSPASSVSPAAVTTVGRKIVLPFFRRKLRHFLDDASNSVTEKIKSCEPVAHLEITLPDALFVDPDELNGKWPLSYSSEPTMHQASGGNWEVSDWKLDPPSVDIERPSFGSPALRHTLYLSMRPQAFFEESDIKSEVEMEIPLHARYLAPSDEGKRTLLFPGDDGSEIRSGWTCASELTQSKFSF
ncbi:hypothetical protein I307_04686 [Cryptococcus deuterogattii 99/473]|uniref:Protein PBN1 n=1 Tax=Cryptococcus deuterogattii Ram5 TaxID=1296110 RepID=A0A0D0VBG3_9TREE|nr:hypothetical protein I309_03410 [Cryptococcus deuterogattii LA55]KIR42125.1 hypothetical protein I313_02291 [Cryptococcus deuterogattii Ram5]KIR73050.1 hypothetical protein I310_02710 [Cryptococcus deuterogattii CA1014]KIR90173.1 hypothetical protein I304_06109 [Cryptococcus deuterogattii CBS 10090]KIR98805.1 hypothetical protein L804_03421 [Cryptococcus deuterogattii 2001/935-1]KIY56020.1 hypothetical protein I307_04686 [Cryptococcus deuterogattii 99/473]